MTTAAATLDLMTFHSGRAVFQVADDGELVHEENVVTVKMQPGEAIDAFLQRLRRELLRPGDVLELLNNGGKLDLARITRRSR